MAHPAVVVAAPFAVSVAVPAVVARLPAALLPDAVVLLATRSSLFATPRTPERALLTAAPGTDSHIRLRLVLPKPGPLQALLTDPWVICGRGGWGGGRRG